MGLFKRESAPCEVQVLPGMHIVDESHHQDTLSAVAANLVSGYRDYSDAHPAIPVTIQLRRDPKNHLDPNSVECLIEGLVIGRLNSEAAAQLQHILRECEQRHQKAELPGFLDGGATNNDGIESDWSVKLGTPS
jgi:hypothetical protein